MQKQTDILFGVRLVRVGKWDGEPWRVSWRLKGQRKRSVTGLTEASANALKQRITCAVRDYEPLDGRQAVAWSYERMSEPCGI